jgi:site-specific DNA-methyltransferase (adenine-specific)
VNGLPRNTILQGDALTRLRALPDASVDVALSSPPFYAVRDYHVDGQLGLEDNVEGWVADLTAVFSEVARVLKPTGSCWIDLADSYSRHPRYGAPAKGLLLAPERLMLALADTGWMVRNKVIWARTNPRPHSVRDRLTCGYDVIVFAARSRRYHFDLDAIRVAVTPATPRYQREAWAGPLAPSVDWLHQARALGIRAHPLGKNPGDVWRLPTRSFRGAHFATFPPALVERPILATCPERTCASCGVPWERERTRGAVRHDTAQPRPTLTPQCSCGTGTVPGVVLDCFGGSGTTAEVARRLQRDWLLIELNAEYCRLAARRLGLPLSCIEWSNDAPQEHAA